MASSSKKLCNNETSNRLSNLSDDIRVHILSYLPTKYGVGTSLLSKKWDTLWSSVADLDFNQHQWFNPEKKQNPNANRDFAIFVDRVIHSYKSSQIRKFILTGYDIDLWFTNEWIDYAIRRKVQVLDVNVDRFRNHYTNYTFLYVDLSSRLFTCKTLSVLKIKVNQQLVIPNVVSLPNLRILHVTLLSPERILLETFFRGFPALEELFLKAEYIVNAANLNVIVPSLKRLNICLTTLYHHHLHQILISAPNLEYFTLVDDIYPVCSVKESNSIIKAVVNVGINIVPNSLNKRTSIRMLKFLKEISSVKILSLSATTRTVIAAYGNLCKLPTFENLIGLRVEFADRLCLSLLQRFIVKSPNLEVLSLKRATGGIQKLDRGVFLPNRTLRNLKDNLKSIEFINYSDHNYDLRVIKCLVKNSISLKKVTLLFKDVEAEEKQDIISGVSAFSQDQQAFQVQEIVNIYDSFCFEWKSSEN